MVTTINSSNPLSWHRTQTTAPKKDLTSTHTHEVRTERKIQRIRELKKDVLETALTIAAMVALVLFVSHFVIFPLIKLKSTMHPNSFAECVAASMLPIGPSLGLLTIGAMVLREKIQKIYNNRNLFKEAFCPKIFERTLTERT